MDLKKTLLDLIKTLGHNYGIYWTVALHILQSHLIYFREWELQYKKLLLLTSTIRELRIRPIIENEGF